MGRVQGTRARVLLTVALAVAVPLAVVAAGRLSTTGGAPAISLTTALVVAHLLSVGPRGAPLAWGAFALHGIVVGGAGPGVGLALLAVVQAMAAMACVRLLEARFAHHGPERTPAVNVDHALIAAAALPLLVVGADALLSPLLGLDPWPGPVLQQVLAEGIGVLALTAGVRMLAMGERFEFLGQAMAGAVAAAAATTAAALVTLQVGGIETLGSFQVVLLPVLLVALTMGTATYTIAVALATIGIVAPAAIAGTAGAWPIDLPTHVAWWVVGFVGLLLSTYGDRRRATAVEFRTFFMRSATPSISVNAADGTISRANEAVAALVGSRVQDLVGRPVVELVQGESTIVTGLEQLLAGALDECSEEFVLRASPGQERWVRCTASRVALGGPQHDVLQVQFLDLTAEHERADALERSNQALERFGRRVTHDLKQPLSAVAAYASTLNEHGQQLPDSVVRTMHERLEAVARRAVTQLDDTFAAASASEGRSVPARLPEVVAAVAGVTDIELSETGGTIDMGFSVTRLRTDPAVLRQVLLNLLTNSLKYARDDTAPRIHIGSRVRGAGVEITVTDNGTGIPADQLEDVFDRGRRLDPGRADGRGHGLADSRELAQDLGGWLEAEPWPDGARFVLWLPDPSAAGSEAATRVLLVEDDPDQLTVLRRRLELQRSIEIVGTATTISGAVAATRDLRPDVVLLDRWLHSEDGLQGVVGLARAHPDVRIILLSAHVPPGLPDQARSGGVLQTLEKGIPDDVLVAELVGRGAR